MDTIAVVGNATSLLDQDYGRFIDGHHEVIRFNQGVPHNPQSQGMRTTTVVTYSEGKWDKIAHHWDGIYHEIVDPHMYKAELGCHPSTLFAYLWTIRDLPNVSIFGVDHNKSWSFYQDHKGYNHNWNHEAKILNEWLKIRNNWRIYV